MNKKVLIDSSIWVDHIRSPDKRLELLYENNVILCHPFVIGELAVGNLHNRKKILRDFHKLPQSIIVDEEEVLEFIEKNSLFGRGIGYVDMHLLASAILSSALLWTRDKRLDEIAVKLGIGFKLDKLIH